MMDRKLYDLGFLIRRKPFKTEMEPLVVLRSGEAGSDSHPETSLGS